MRRNIFAVLGLLITWGLFFADGLDRARRVWEAPDNAFKFWEVVRVMFAEASDLAWAIFALGVICLAVATIEWWGPLVRDMWQSISAAERGALPPKAKGDEALPAAQAVLPYDVDARSAILYAANRTWVRAARSGPVSPGLAGELDRVFKALDLFYELAASGALRVWGRKSMSRPPQLVEKEHWQEWHIDYTTVFADYDAEPLRTVPRDRLPHGGSPYYDLRLNRQEVEKAWPPSSAGPLMALLELRALAAMNGWEFPGTRQLLDFDDALNEAGARGLVDFYGRPVGDQFIESVIRNEPRRKIKRDEWDNLRVSGDGLIDLECVDNFKASLARRNPYSEIAYMDAHVDRGQAEQWLPQAMEFKGRRDAQAAKNRA